VASGDGFAVAWLSWSSTDGWVVKAQLFDLVGNKVGDEVEGPGTDLQEEWIPAVAMAQDGGFVVVRKGVRKAGGLGLLGMWFVDKGDVVIADEEPFDVTNFNLVDLAYPRIFSVPGPEGNFLALWEQHEVGGSDWLNAWGRIVGLEEPPQFMINEMTDGAQGQPVAAIAPDGSFLALFLSDGVNEYGFGIAGRFFDNQGRARKEETRILFTGGDYEYMQPQAVVTEGGGFVMAAERSRDVAAPSQDGVVIQFRDAELERRAPDRRANLYERQFQTWPRLAALPGGEAVVVWQSCPHNPDDEFVDLPGQDGHGCGVFAQRFDSSGKRLER